LKIAKIKKASTLFFFIFIVFLSKQCLSLEPPSKHFSLILDTPMAYVLDSGRLEATFFYERIDSSLDIFDVRKNGGDGKTIDSSSLGNLGDYQSFGGIINFGLTDRITLSFKAEFPEIDVGDNNLKITKIAPAIRWNVLTEKSLRPAISLGFSYKNNRGENIKRRFSQLTLAVDGTTIGPIDFSKPQTIEIGGIKDETYSFSLYLSKLLLEDLVAHGFLEFGTTRVRSEFDTSIKIAQIQNLLKGVEYDQKNFAIGAGFHYRFKPYLIFNFNYKFITVDRDINNNIGRDFTKNNIIDVKLNYILNKYVAITWQAKYFSNSLLGEIPFLYNKFTSNQFDNPYGYLGIGVTFSYDYRGWAH